jgi:putative transposase
VSHTAADHRPRPDGLVAPVRYHPDFPRDAFADLASATGWVAAFVAWYNDAHQHSAIRFVTPVQRHAGSDQALLAHRNRVYAAAKARHPERWSGATRDWSPILTVRLNPQDGAARELRQ